MTSWYELYAQHRDIRAISADFTIVLRKRLVTLADRGHCQETIQGRFAPRSLGRRRELYILPAGSGGPRSELLVNLPTLQEARLTVLAMMNGSMKHLHQFTAMIEGITRKEQPWVAAVHLEEDYASDKEDRKANGACSHAAFHCHVGPTLDDEPKVRVPLPALGPEPALDWLLSLVVPGWEPAPWSELPPLRPAQLR
jgi:hypothetical protein